MRITTPLQAADNGSISRTVLNDNFTAVEVAIEEVINDGAPLATTSVAGRSRLSSAPVDAAVPIAVGDNDTRLLAVNASETVKGVVEEATDAEVTAGTDVGATGAKLFVTPATYQTDVATNFSATRFYQVSNQVIYTGNDTARFIDNAAWTLIKEMTINEAIALVRLSAEAQQEFTSSGGIDYSEVRFYINDVAVGSATTPTRSNTLYTTITHDATSLSSGDRLQVFCRVSGTAVDSIEVRNFRLSYDSAVTKIAKHVLVTPLLSTDPVALNVTANT